MIWSHVWPGSRRSDRNDATAAQSAVALAVLASRDYRRGSKSTDGVRNAPKLFTHLRKLLKSERMRPPSERTTIFYSAPFFCAT
jgi:hypothetical protein